MIKILQGHVPLVPPGSTAPVNYIRETIRCADNDLVTTWIPLQIYRLSSL